MSRKRLGRRDFLRAAGIGAAGVALPCGAQTQNTRPNIVVIMCDDMGYSDIGCFGGEVRTPNLDGLAKRGLRLSQFYNTARCCPTRAALMSGLYPHQAGMGSMVGLRPKRGYEGRIMDRCVTIAEVLGAAGYQTRMSGKWHLSPFNANENEPLARETWPLQRGFEKWFGTICGAGSFYTPKGLMRGNEIIEASDPDFYYTDAVSDYAADCVRECAGKEDPFFLYTAYTAPHWPLHALEEDIARYEERYTAGWDALREERYARMVDMGLVDKRWPLSPRSPKAEPWNDAPHKAWQARRMAVYAAMIDRMDQGIGRIVKALEDTGVSDNTLVLFMSDNGGCAESVSGKGGSAKVALDRAIKAGRPMQAGNDPEVMPGPKSTFQSYGASWACASNTPYRFYKKWGHEGGISTPFIACWPERIKAAGEINNSVGHVIDVMPTCVEVAGAAYPEEFGGHEILPVEGKSLVPVFETGTRQGHALLGWEHIGNRAIRCGDWKLVAEKKGPWELFELQSDRTEMNNLIEKESERAKDLMARWDAWAKRVYVT